MPDGLTTIKQCAFRNCELLRSIIIPDTVTTIDPDAFNECNKLQQRQVDHPNYHLNTITWLHQRFNNLPIHRDCQPVGGASQSASADTA